MLCVYSLSHRCQRRNKCRRAKQKQGVLVGLAVLLNTFLLLSMLPSDPTNYSIYYTLLMPLLFPSLDPTLSFSLKQKQTPRFSKKPQTALHFLVLQSETPEAPSFTNPGLLGFVWAGGIGVGGESFRQLRKGVTTHVGIEKEPSLGC